MVSEAWYVSSAPPTVVIELRSHRPKLLASLHRLAPCATCCCEFPVYAVSPPRHPPNDVTQNASTGPKHINIDPTAMLTIA
ncbi:hypothetical protein TPAR_07186 [Tolypocladium paradoxum]|uniref:Uncharacterized protein n=1 Tax=Tolypocladium paradoxum TaxID=94208 RepID=A0A2S4KQY6_9HYPO|nr:hypothetical protein TPAR_07186 [Tolypocladium paradoxum]